MFTSIAHRSSLASRRPSILLWRTFKSRAHPQPIPEYPVNEAVDSLLKDIEKRLRKRQRKWNKNAPQRQAKGIMQEECKHPDETIELALNLNLDPRKPGQALRGNINLPNGTGKTIQCVVFTSDTDLAEQAQTAGALHAGGESLVEEIVAGQVPVDSFERSLATTEMMPVLSKKAARLLGPRGLMPNAKTGTLLAKEELLGALETQIAGREVLYRTEKAGVVHVPVGKGSFGVEKILENIGSVMKEIFNVKPESYGKGRKSGKATGKGTKYLLSASVSSTQGPGLRLDLRTVDPTSAFFLSSEEKEEAGPAAA